MAALNMKLMTAGADKIYRESEFPIASLNIKRDESAADMLEVKLVGEVKEFPSFLRVYLGGNMIFDGITDDLIFSRSDEGEFTELVARDMFSLLTDNELRPGSLRNPSLRLFAERFLVPLGFEIRGNMASFRGDLVIKEGCSVFRGLADFCKSFMGTEAKRRGNVLYCGVERPVVRLEDKYPVLSFERAISRFAVASKLYVKSSTSANYTVAVKEFENILFGENNIDKTIKEVVEVFKEDYEYRDSSKYITYYKGITTDKIDNALKHFESLPKDFYDTQKRIDFIKQVNKLCGKYTNFNVIEKSQYGSNYKVYDLETSIQETDKQSANTIWVCINGKYSTSGENGWDDFFVNFKFDFNDYAQTGEISLVHQRVYNFNDLYITLIKNGFKFHSNTEDKFNVHREYYTCYTYKK